MEVTFHDLSHLALPFRTLESFFTSCLFQSSKNSLLEKLENNNFTKEMIEHVNEISKDNYTCKYYDAYNIEKLSKLHLKSALKSIHLNCSSLAKNGPDFVNYLEHLKVNFDIIMLTETRQTTDGFVQFLFPEYNVFLENPETSKGGACILVAKNKFKNVKVVHDNSLRLRNKCDCPHCEIDDIWVSLENNNKKTLIGCIYRHPKAEIGKSHFSNNLNEVLKNTKDSTTTIIAGDFNINLLDTQNNHVDLYLNTVLQNAFIPCVTLPTRVTDHSVSLIDHILVKTPKNLIHNKVSAGNLIADISDHLPNILFIDQVTQKYKDRPLTRLFSPNKISKFTENVSQENVLISYENNININDNDLQNTYKEFNTNFHNLLNKYFPLVKQSRKQTGDKPYITSGIKESIKSRNTLYKTYLENPTNTNEQNWKEKRNGVVDILRKAEADYYASFIKNRGDNSRQLWKRFGEVLGKSKAKKISINKMLIDNDVTSDPKTIVNEFNRYFCTIGEKLASKFGNRNNNEFKKYLQNPSQHSLVLSRITEKEIILEIKNLDPTKSPGQDDFTAKFLKVSATTVAPILCDIFNLSIQRGEYPDILKIAKVLPIFKKGDSKLTSNYRPISVLSCINKIFEKILFKRIYNFLEKHSVLYEFQYGFRQGHSTTHALIEIVDKIKKSIDKNELTCSIFLDLSKAFDTVNHDILMYKLDHYGIRGPAHKLLRSYLSNRKQFVKIGDLKSELQNINCGVPQGSVLGPLLFLLYINDLPIACPLGSTHIFADDTNIFFSCKDADEISTIGGMIMTQLDDWFKANKLTLNADKSNFVVFRSKRKKITDIPNQIQFGNTSISRNNSIKYLGVILDEYLTWEEHITDVCNKLKRYYKVFYCIRKYVNTEQIKNIYYALIYSRIKYAIPVFGFTSSNKLDRLQTLQNKLLKVLLARNYRFSTNLLHNELEILKVKDIAKMDALTFVFNYLGNNLPRVFNNYFILKNDFHNINIRGADTQIQVDRWKKDIGHTSVKIMGATLWNQTKNSIKESKNIKIFRNKIKKDILPYQMN